MGERTAHRPTGSQTALDCLRDLVRTLPVPTTPRTRSRADEELGLGILELSLRLSHVTRLTEHLELIERGHLGRRISLDVDLQALSSRHRTAIRADTADPYDDFLWVPVARFDRSDPAAVVVTDAQADVVPRLTNRETARVTVAAVLQLFRMLLDVDPQSATEGSDIFRLRTEWHRARWLVESAITTLIDSGLPASARPSVSAAVRGRTLRPERSRESLIGIRAEGERAQQWPADERYPGDAPPAHLPRVPVDEDARDGRRERGRALQALDALFEPAHESTFLPLLLLAATEHPLVVLLPTSTPKQYLSFAAPHLRERSPRRPRLPGRAAWRSALRLRQDFTMEYETSIPRSVNSFHVALTVDPAVRVRHCYLSASSDLALVDTLRLDMQQCADDTATLLRDDHAPVLELELASIASRLGELAERRMRDLAGFRMAWNLDFAEHLQRPRAGGPPQALTPQTDADAGTGHLLDDVHPVCSLARFAHELSTGRYEQFAGVTFDPDLLRHTAAALDRQELGWDLVTDNDPREDHAHLHWRRAEQAHGSKSTDPLAARIVVVLGDDPPSLAASVARMTLALAVLVAAMIGYLGRTPAALLPWRTSAQGHFQSGEAAVTMLLLVPGLLLSRLDLPATSTVLGQLRMLPRLMAYTAVTMTTGGAAYVALRGSDAVPLWPLAAVLWGLVAVGGYTALSLVVQSYTEASLVPRSVMLPRWLSRECTWGELRRNLRPSARFAVVERRRS